ncbi:MAG TPA: hypothetical protein VMD53_19945 [Rhizomicrobium sp.]|nr:hypothetical protein [Rhizomicrobium sp.]
MSILGPQEISSKVISDVLAVWQSRAGKHDIPARDAVLPKPMAPFMRHISLMRWIAEESDYETRFIGDAHVQAYGETAPAGHRMSTTIAERPEFGNMLKSSYDMARMRRTPLIIRGFIGPEFPDARFVWFETVYLPLRGPADDVEFVMNAAVYQPKDGAWPT